MAFPAPLNRFPKTFSAMVFVLENLHNQLFALSWKLMLFFRLLIFLLTFNLMDLLGFHLLQNGSYRHCFVHCCYFVLRLIIEVMVFQIWGNLSIYRKAGSCGQGLVLAVLFWPSQEQGLPCPCLMVRILQKERLEFSWNCVVCNIFIGTLRIFILGSVYILHMTFLCYVVNYWFHLIMSV